MFLRGGEGGMKQIWSGLGRGRGRFWFEGRGGLVYGLFVDVA